LILHYECITKLIPQLQLGVLFRIIDDECYVEKNNSVITRSSWANKALSIAEPAIIVRKLESGTHTHAK
jgi:sulfur carrier protein ThiS